MRYQGSCHCGNLGVWLETAREPADTPLRRCQCGFCRKHEALSVTDPAGCAGFSVRDPQQLQRYRFGLHTADYLVCRNCGVYVGAVTEIEGQRLAVINANALTDRSRFTSPPEPVSYEGERKEERNARRRRRWTPVVEFGI